MRRLIALIAAGFAMLALGVIPAGAQTSTDTTFVLDGSNTLAVSANATEDLGTLSGAGILGNVTADTAYSGSFVNAVSVEDSRTGLLRSFSVSVSATSANAIVGAAFELVEDPDAAPFTATTGDTSTWIPANDSTQYQWGALTDVVGDLLAGSLVTTVDGDVDGADADDASLSASGHSETVVVEWTPTIEVTVPPTQMAGKYQGTVTHSVS